MKKTLIIAMMVVVKLTLVAAALILAANAQQEKDVFLEARAERVFEENQSAWALWKEEEKERRFQNAVVFTYLGQDMAEINEAKALIAEAERVEEARHGLSNEAWVESYNSDLAHVNHLYWLAGQKLVNWANRVGRYPIGFKGVWAALDQYRHYDETGKQRREGIAMPKTAEDFLNGVNAAFGSDIFK